MLMKLALRNVRRSMRDYAVYFVTLTLGVAVFYAFNAIEDSRVLFEAQEGAANVFLASGASIFDILAQVMTYFSVVVAVVLGFLVLYANRFVVRARKKEFGTYLLLGMSPRQVSSVVLMETLIVGVIALLAGLGLGFLISQAIAFATAGLIGVAISDYHLLFSARSAERLWDASRSFSLWSPCSTPCRFRAASLPRCFRPTPATSACPCATPSSASSYSCFRA